MPSIFSQISFDVQITLTKESELVVNKFLEKKDTINFDVNLGLDKAFTSFSNADISSGELLIVPNSAENNAMISFEGVVEISENYMKTIIPYFSIPNNEVIATSIDLSMSKNDVIEYSHVFDFESPVKWALLEETLPNKSPSSESKRSITGTLLVAWARLSRIESNDICAEDSSQVIKALRDVPDFLESIKKSKSKVSAIWDLDSDMISNLSVTKVNVGSFVLGELPALKNVEITFACDAEGEYSNEEIESEITTGLMPFINNAGTKFVFFDCDELSCKFN